jgi:hypothetical protein
MAIYCAEEMANQMVITVAINELGTSAPRDSHRAGRVSDVREVRCPRTGL